MDVRKIRLLPSTMLSLAVVAIIAIACGGGDSNGGPSGTGSDEDYVRGLCNAFDDVSETFAKFEDGDFEDPEFIKELGLDEEDFEDMDFEEVFTAMFEAMFASMGPAMGDLADDLNPPADVKPCHDEAVVAMKQLADLFEDGGFDLSSLEDDPFEEVGDVEFPADIEERLAAIAKDIPGCADLELFEDEA